MAQMDDKPQTSRPVAAIESIGAATNGTLEYIGGIAYLGFDSLWWVFQALVLRKVRFGRGAMYIQLIRVGVKSVSIIVLVSLCIGVIMVMQMAPPLRDYGQVDKVANVNAVAILRELGPLISAIVLTGFAGASIAAELGTMVVGEEIEALEAMALDPVRFLVVPRVMATVIGLVVLTVFADLVAVGSGSLIGVFMLDIPWGIYKSNTLDQAELIDFITGLAKSGVFGMLIGMIACYNGLKVTGGAAGVGRATTITVVHAIVSIIIADMLFTAMFYLLGWT